MEIRPNDIVGRVGKAWVISGEGWPATVAGYYIHRPAGLPWTWWQIAVVHLREVEGAPPAKIFLPGATHEFGEVRTRVVLGAVEGQVHGRQRTSWSPRTEDRPGRDEPRSGRTTGRPSGCRP